MGLRNTPTFVLVLVLTVILLTSQTSAHGVTIQPSEALVLPSAQYRHPDTDALGNAGLAHWALDSGEAATTLLSAEGTDQVFLPLILSRSNRPPRIPANPFPRSGATDQNTETTLTWQGGDPDGDSVTYDVYFAPGDDSPDILLCDDVIRTWCYPGPLSHNTHYYWSVNATDEQGEVVYGPIWEFRTGSSGPPPDEMILIPAGEFLMGRGEPCEPYKPCDADEEPQHSVYLDAYYIDKYEVTNALYSRCVMDGVCAAPYPVAFFLPWYYGNPAYANYPVVNVSWYSAEDYCAWAGRRLPTEAEWEKAARGTDARTYPWGNGAPSCDRLSFPYCQGIATATLVGSYPSGASPYGVLDMAGNVSEWTKDWYGEDYYATSPYHNPQGPARGTGKVTRGGSIQSDAIGVRTIERNWPDPAWDADNRGFRCAATP